MMRSMKKKTKISDTFRRVRKALGITQETFAKMLGRSRVSISTYETGTVVPPADVYEKVLRLQDSLRDQK